MKFKFVLLTIIISFFLFAKVCANILFSEIFPNTEDLDLEYIELYNSSDSEKSLS
jgi:hypothetical protein